MKREMRVEPKHSSLSPTEERRRLLKYLSFSRRGEAPPIVRRVENRDMNRKDEFKIKHSRGYNSIVTFQHLRYVIAAADNGSFRRAAEILLVRQSTLSRCIRQLEHSIGLTVFERSSGGVRVTKAGLNFLRVSRSILEQVASLIEAARRTGQGKGGQLAIGFSTSLSTGPLRETMVDQIERFPQIEIGLLEGFQTRLVTALLNREIDVTILKGEQELRDCRSMPLWSEHMLVALPEGHELATREALYWTDIRKEAVVLSQYDSGRAPEDIGVPKAGSPDAPATTKFHNVGRSTILNLVSMGLGVSLVDESDIGASIAGIVYRQIRQGAEFDRVSYSAYWREDNENPALTAFLKLLAARYPPATRDLSE